MSIIYRNEIPYLEEQDLAELTNSMQTPFYVYSQKNRCIFGGPTGPPK